MAKKKVSFKELLGIEEILHPEKKDLHPPRAPIPLDPAFIEKIQSYDLKPIAGEIEGEVLRQHPVVDQQIKAGERFDSVANSKPAIDFKAIANSSEFQRFIYYLFTGRTHRGSLERLKKDISEFKEESELVRSYKGVMQEFKEKVARLRK